MERGGGAAGRGGRLCRARRTGHRGVDHGPLAAGLLLGGKVGYIMWKELKEAEGRAENLLEDDLDGLNRKETKRAPPLCLDIREMQVSKEHSPSLKKKKKNRQLPEYFPVAFHGRFGSSSQTSCLYLEHSRRGTEVQNDNSEGRACLSMPFISEINYLQ